MPSSRARDGVASRGKGRLIVGRAMDDLDDRIRSLVVRHLEVGPQEVVGLARFNTDLGADSLDKIELMMAFEDEFGCEITDEIADTILTVSDVRNFLERNARR
jgi:acyl carrier protein